MNRIEQGAEILLLSCRQVLVRSQSQLKIATANETIIRNELKKVGMTLSKADEMEMMCMQFEIV